MKKTIKSIIVSLLMVLASSVNATTVTYIMNQSNSLDDNVDYLSVMLSEETEGQLDFWVQPQSELTDIAGENFGIQSFAFNYREILGLTEEDFILPEGWKFQSWGGMSEAGSFDVRLLGQGNSRQDPLHFSVRGLGIDDLLGQNWSNSSVFFAAHVAGFGPLAGECSEIGSECEGITSAFFFGGALAEEQPASVVPLPASLWLFGSGLLGLVGMARRRQEHYSTSP